MNAPQHTIQKQGRIGRHDAAITIRVYASKITCELPFPKYQADGVTYHRTTIYDADTVRAVQAALHDQDKAQACQIIGRFMHNSLVEHMGDA